MTEITVTNTDWEIIEDLDDALTAATIAGDKVFKSVTVASSDEQAKEVQFKGVWPRVIILYTGTTENESPEDYRGCAVAVQLMVATKVARSTDESARVKEALRLINAVKNAIETTPPAAAIYWGDGDYWHDKLQWDSPELDTTEKQFWTAATIPLEVGYLLTANTSH